jgi:hypothetical protein
MGDDWGRIASGKVIVLSNILAMPLFLFAIVEACTLHHTDIYW